MLKDQRSWTFGANPPCIKLCPVRPPGILLTIFSLHLGQNYLLLQLYTLWPGFHPVPDEWSYPNALISPSWTMCARTPLQLHSLNRQVSWEEHREYGEGHCAGPVHLACNLYGKVIKPCPLHLLTHPLSYKTLDPQEARTNFKGTQSAHMRTCALNTIS